jgi:hypothetical protein
VFRICIFLVLPDPHPDPLVRDTDPRIRILTKMSRIPTKRELYQKFRFISVARKEEGSLPMIVDLRCPTCISLAMLGEEKSTTIRFRGPTCGARTPCTTHGECSAIVLKRKITERLSLNMLNNCTKTIKFSIQKPRPIVGFQLFITDTDLIYAIKPCKKAAIF